jgi:hypothetical protein
MSPVATPTMNPITIPSPVRFPMRPMQRRLSPGFFGWERR